MNYKVYRFDDFYLNPKQRKLFYRDDPLPLSARAFEILLLLVEKQGEVITKEDFLRKIWSGDFVEESNLVVHISALRRVLREKRGEQKFIQTVSGRGYIFVEPVFETEPAGTSSAQPPPPHSATAATPAEDLAADFLTAPVSIAVLPFGYETGDDDLKYLANGVTQSLIDFLSQIPKLKVMAHGATAQFKSGGAGDLQEAGFLLGVDYLLLGTISEYKGQLEISVELVGAADKSHVWGTQYQCRFDDIFRVKKEISLVISEKLKLRLSDIERLPFSNDEAPGARAYSLYLKGIYLLDNYQTGEDYHKTLNKALGYFEQSVKQNPNFAPAYIGMTRVYNNLIALYLVDRREAFRKSRTLIQMALKLDKNFAEAYVSNGIVQLAFEQDLKAARESLRRAVRLQPNSARASHFLSLVCSLFGDFGEALQYQKRALRLNPTSAAFNCGLANHFLYMKRYNEAITRAEETLEFHPHSVHAFFIIARAFLEMGMREAASDNIRKALAINPSAEIFLLEAHFYAAGGDARRAEQIIRRLLEESEPGHIDFADVAKVYAVMGETEKAFAYLEKAVNEGSIKITVLKIDPGFDSLRGDERFPPFLRRIGLA